MTDRARTLRRRMLGAALAASLLAAGCSSDGSDGAAKDDGSTTTAPSAGGSGTTAAPGDSKPFTHTCTDGATGDLGGAEPVAGSDTDWTITSFDGTEIRAHWFPATPDDGEPAPTVLMGPGWSLAGDTSLDDGDVLFGALSISGMLDRGYNVLTWDPRGFGESTGSASVNAAELEGRDAQVLLDWVASQPESATDAKGDPRVGMVGFSYGGGIQLTLAGIDCRVDALVPGIAWHSLETSLFKNRTVKQGWSSVLVNVATQGNLDPHIKSASKSGGETGTLSAADEAWFVDRGPGDLVDDIDVPTLFVQGTVDTLFTLDEAITNHAALVARDVPTAMLWFCGGHGVCLTDPGDVQRVTEASFAWLDRYLVGNTSADVVPAFETLDQDGTGWTADAYPEADAAIEGHGTGTLALEASSAAGPIDVPTDNPDLLGGLVAPITPGPAEKSVEVAIDPGDVEGLALGAPEVSITYSGTIGAGEEPVRVFAQLVDDENDVVVGNQITPIPLTLDGKEHTATIDLEVISQQVARGRTLTLQLVATTVAYATPRLGGTVTFSKIDVTVPVVTKGVTKVEAAEKQ